MAGRGSRRTTFDKLQRERARREKQALKRARRQGEEPGRRPATFDGPPDGSAIPTDESRS